MSWMNLFGGWPGVATFALMACGVMALPLKFPYYDNLLLVIFSSFTYLLAANSAAYAFGREEVAKALAEGTGDGDRSAVIARARAPFLAGFLGWAALLGISLASLHNVRTSAGLPAPFLLAGLAALNAGLAWLVAMLGALVGVSVQTVKGARDLLRLGFTFLLVVAVLAFFISPDPWRSSLARVTRSERNLAAALLLTAGVFVAASEFLLRRVLRLLAEKRQGLSILG